MCGIAGLLGAGPMVPESVVQRVMAGLAHRGPEDTGCHREAGALLLHSRLSIIDVVGGHQPLSSEDGSVVAVVNGEIYNHLELRAELEALGHRFSSASDSEVVVHGYRQWGTAVVERLYGMFAFAVVDRERERQILARDRLGMKPLFMAPSAGRIAFASEIKSLLPLLDVTPELEPVALLRYLQHQYAAGRQTILHGVERVLPAELLVIEGGEVRERRCYWSATRVETRDMDFRAASTGFDDLFDQVLREHLRSDVPIGLFLSGGVDSSVLLAALTRLRGGPMSTYSVGFDRADMIDELPLAARVAEGYEADHHPFAPAPETLLGYLPRTVWAADDLMRDFASLPTYHLAAEAARSLKVVFSGEGGDEAFAGYGRYRVNAFERGLKGLLYPGSGGFRTGRLLRGRRAAGLLGPALREVSDRELRAPMIEAFESTPAGWSMLQRMQYVDIATALPDNLLVKADRMLMASGVEGRLPFVDHRIVEFGLGLPDQLKVADGTGKRFLKRWAEQLVPKDLLYAPKRGFHVPVRQWFGPQLPRLARVLPEQPAVRRWFRAQGVRRLLARDQRLGALSPAGFAVFQFALWHRIMIDEAGRDPGTGVDPVAFLEGA